ncbi:MAG TPA: hypothetical protein VMU35_03880 [Methylomirabilota bacterium]|nr:hypothetical protein [Methylomirabilota bacterium]
MSPLDELVSLLNEKSRRIFVAEQTIEFNNAHGENCVYVLELPGASPGSAGGRIGGFGERRVVKLLCFRQHDGKWVKLFESENLERLERLELPYHATGLSVILPDGRERVVSGVVDPEFVRKYNERE